MNIDDIPTGRVLKAREFFALRADAIPFIPELHRDDCEDVTCVRCVEAQPSIIQAERDAAEKARRDAFAEEQRLYRELDADSYWPMPGCVCPVCPPAGVTIPRAGTE